MFCCALLYGHSRFAISLMGKRELVALLSVFILVSLDCCVALPCDDTICLQFVKIAVFPDHTH